MRSRKLLIGCDFLHLAPSSKVSGQSGSNEVKALMPSIVRADEAVLQLYESYADDVYRYALYTLANEADARDAVQDVFLRAYQGWEKFRAESSAKTWLLSIARHCVIDFLRQRRSERKRRSSLVEAYREPITPDIDSDLEWREVLGGLPDSYRQVLILHSIDGLDLRETAAVLGWSEAKVRTTHHRAKKKLALLLQADEPSDNRSRSNEQERGLRT